MAGSATKQSSFLVLGDGLLRFARNDDACELVVYPSRSLSLLLLAFDELAMRSSSLNSASVSSSFGFEGLGKGITSDIVWSLTLHVRAVSPFSPAIAAFLRRPIFVGS
jgi:hypothetical protein